MLSITTVPLYEARGKDKAKAGSKKWGQKKSGSSDPERFRWRKVWTKKVLWPEMGLVIFGMLLFFCLVLSSWETMLGDFDFFSDLQFIVYSNVFRMDIVMGILATPPQSYPPQE